MAVNGARGEVEVVLGGERRVLCLTLGALAAMESGLGCAGVGELSARLRTPSAGDLAVVLGALAPGMSGEEIAGLRLGEVAEAVTAAFRAAG